MVVGKCSFGKQRQEEEDWISLTSSVLKRAGERHFSIRLAYWSSGGVYVGLSKCEHVCYACVYMHKLVHVDALKY